MREKLRKTGLDIIGEVPWGTHLCQFYQTKEDLIDILVSYFKAGLENNEFCMWVCWDPLRAEEARVSLSKRLKNLDNYIKKGQIEIVDYSRQQTEREDSGFTKMKQFWIDKERQALERGFEGLRLAGNTYWLEKREWKDFKQYETEVDDIIRNHKMLAICPYSIDKCGAPEIIDVIGGHKSALIKREGRWEIIESSGRKKAEEVLQRTKQQMEFILGATKTGLDIIDSDFNMVYIDPEWQKVYGNPTGKKCYKYFMGSNTACPNCGIVKALKTKKPVVSEEVLVKEGNRPIQVTTIPLS